MRVTEFLNSELQHCIKFLFVVLVALEDDGFLQEQLRVEVGDSPPVHESCSMDGTRLGKGYCFLVDGGLKLCWLYLLAAAYLNQHLAGHQAVSLLAESSLLQPVPPLYGTSVLD